MTLVLIPPGSAADGGSVLLDDDEQHHLKVRRVPAGSDVVFTDGAGAEGEALLGRMLAFTARVATNLGLDASGYRIVTNTGDHGGQSVHHLHLHLLGGRQLHWPPG